MRPTALRARHGEEEALGVEREELAERPDPETIRDVMKFLGVVTRAEVLDRETAELPFDIEESGSIVPNSSPFNQPLTALAARVVKVRGLYIACGAANLTAATFQIGQMLLPIPVATNGAFLLLDPWIKYWRPGDALNISLTGAGAGNTSPLAWSIWGRLQPTAGTIW